MNLCPEPGQHTWCFFGCINVTSQLPPRQSRTTHELSLVATGATIIQTRKGKAVFEIKGLDELREETGRPRGTGIQRMTPSEARSTETYRANYCVGSINFMPEASSGFFFNDVVLVVRKTSNVGFTFNSKT